MKITKSQLKQIIKEEISKVLSEDVRQRRAFLHEKCSAREEEDSPYSSRDHFTEEEKKYFPKGYSWRYEDRMLKRNSDMELCMKGLPGQLDKPNLNGPLRRATTEKRDEEVDARLY